MGNTETSDEALLPTEAEVDALVAGILADSPSRDPIELALALLHCRVCGAPLAARRASRRTCSDRCRQRLSRARRG